MSHTYHRTRTSTRAWIVLLISILAAAAWVPSADARAKPKHHSCKRAGHVSKRAAKATRRPVGKVSCKGLTKRHGSRHASTALSTGSSGSTTPQGSSAGGITDVSTAVAGTAAIGPLRLFAPDSVWNAPLGPDARLDPTSGARSAALLAEIRREIGVGVGPWIDERQYSTPIYTVPVSQPRVRVKLDNGASWALSLASALSAGVPIPPGAKPAAGTDGYMTIYQPSTDMLWEFWRASLKADGWHAAWGGAMRNASTSVGYYSNAAWPGLGPLGGWNWGGTAASLPVAAGVAQIAELAQGHIDHALAVDLPSVCGDMFSWPAQRTDGTSIDPNCLPEGAHLRVDPNLDLSSVNMPPITRMLAEAAQKYGMIVRDRTGKAFGFFAEDPTPTGTDPYNGPGGFYGGLRPWKFLPKFPWASVELLQMTPCSAAPCLPTAAAGA